MTSQCKKLLIILNKLSNSSEQSLFMELDGQGIVNKNKESINLGHLSRESESLLKALVNDEYILFDIPDHFPFGNFSLTHKGLHWKQIRNRNIASFILKSILVPVIVSIITTFLALKIR